MKRDAVLLGFLATSGQVLLLRELVTAFGGTELFIGTALFGWLLWVAVGALIGGTRLRLNSQLLFCIGVVLLPLSVVGIRFLPLLITSTMGEMIPLTTAAPLSVIVMGPVGLISGLLFPSIARQGRNAGAAIASVYLFEGIGAFAAGLVTVVLISIGVGNLGSGLAVGALICLLKAIQPSRYRIVLYAACGVMVFLLATTQFGNTLDQRCDQTRYPGYLVEQSFDTPYGHQTVLSRDSTLVLLTDNGVEAVYPDLERTENLLIPPLVYYPEASSVLYVGRAEFGLEQLATQLPNLNLTAVDPRGRLSERLNIARSQSQGALLIDDDPVAYMWRPSTEQFDIIIIALGRLDSYRAGRLVTPSFLEQTKRHLRPQGLLLLATSFDTDRYLSSETGESLAMIAQAVERAFPHITVWPGNATLILGSETNDLTLTVDSLLARIALLPYHPQYVSEYYLGERLSEFKLTRLKEALAASVETNSLEHPVLAAVEACRRARTNAPDIKVAELFLRRPLWLLVLPVLLLIFMIWTSRGRKQGRVGLFLFFTAGLVSLSLELISFYLFQATVGSLYTHLAILIGVFMLGLSLGAWLGSQTVGFGLGWLSLGILLAAIGVFGVTWRQGDLGLALIYHLLFLFVVALATGSLFVAATRHYYTGFEHRSRGTGYAVELVGSACGALLTNAILLPTLGLNLLLAMLGLVVVMGFVTQFGRISLGSR
jgi:spermidine synthase